MHCIACFACICVGVARMAASTPGCARHSPRSEDQCGISNFSATSSRRVGAAAGERDHLDAGMLRIASRCLMPNAPCPATQIFMSVLLRDGPDSTGPTSPILPMQISGMVPRPRDRVGKRHFATRGASGIESLCSERRAGGLQGPTRIHLISCASEPPTLSSSRSAAPHVSRLASARPPAASSAGEHVEAPRDSPRIVQLLTDRQRFRCLGPRLGQIFSDDAQPGGGREQNAEPPRVAARRLHVDRFVVELLRPS